MIILRRNIITKLMLFLQIVLISSCSPSAVVQKKSPPEPAVNSSSAQSQDMVVLSSDSAKSINIVSFLVKSKAEPAELKSTGEIKADENRVFHINSIVAGRVVKDNVQLGDLIKEGAICAVVQNLEVSKVYGDYIHQKHQNEVSLEQAKAKLSLAEKNLDRFTKLQAEGLSPQKDTAAAQTERDITAIELKGYEEHEVHLGAEAKAMLSAYGLNLNDQRPDVIQTGSPVKAPRSGVVIQKNVTLGDVVSVDQVMYIVADLSQIWLDIAIYDKDLDSIAVGQKVIFKSDSLAGRIFSGSISYIPPSAGGTARTFTARAVLSNPKLVLKPGMFGQVIIEKSPGDAKPYLPDSAIQKYGNETFVFIDLGAGRYLKRKIELAEREADGYFVKSGVVLGEQVVGQGSFNLKSELLKTQSAQEE